MVFGSELKCLLRICEGLRKKTTRKRWASNVLFANKLLCAHRWIIRLMIESSIVFVLTHAHSLQNEGDLMNHVTSKVMPNHVPYFILGTGPWCFFVLNVKQHSKSSFDECFPCWIRYVAVPSLGTVFKGRPVALTALGSDAKKGYPKDSGAVEFGYFQLFTEIFLIMFWSWETRFWASCIILQEQGGGSGIYHRRGLLHQWCWCGYVPGVIRQSSPASMTRCLKDGASAAETSNAGRSVHCLALCGCHGFTWQLGRII